MTYVKNLLICLLLNFVAYTVMAEVEENHCINKESAENNETLARKNPNDPIIVRLVALRAGLCDLVGKGVVDLEFAIDLFDAEKPKGVFKRMEEDVINNTDLGA